MLKPIYVLNDDALYFGIQYIDHGDPGRRAALQAGWKKFNRLDPATRQAYQLYVRQSFPSVQVMVEHLLPPGTPSGRYRIETFVPGTHATTRKAIFTVAEQLGSRGEGQIYMDEKVVLVDMLELSDVWYPLGEYLLDPARHADIGRVRQYDMSQEEPPAEVCFGPVRWIPMDSNAAGVRFDAPVGTPEERDLPFPAWRTLFGRYPVWVGEWYDANPFLTWYSYGYHTGADLNLPGVSAADRGKPVFSIGDGRVIYAGRAGSWGNIIVIEHPEALVTYPDGAIERQTVYARYGHVEERMLVRAGQDVSRGQQIGSIGLAAGFTSGWHLHFDICYTDLLKRRPADWPDLSALASLRRAQPDSYAYRNAQASIKRQVIDHYVDPMRFIQDNHISVSDTAGV